MLLGQIAFRLTVDIMSSQVRATHPVAEFIFNDAFCILSMRAESNSGIRAM